MVADPMVVLYLLGIAAAWLFGKSKKTDPDDEYALKPRVRLTSGLFGSRLFRMKIIRHLAFGLMLCASSFIHSVWAQGATRHPAGSNTIFGDTGLWFVPTGETVPKGEWSGSIALVNFDRSEGFSDITDIGGMFAFGVTRPCRVVRHDGLPAPRRGPRSGRAQRPAAELSDQPGLEYRPRRRRRRREVQHPLAGAGQRAGVRGARLGQDPDGQHATTASARASSISCST